MKRYYLSVIISLFLMSSQAQQGPSKKTDSVSNKVIQYLKNRQPDSIYIMTGKTFREKITAENFNSIMTTQIFPKTKFENVKFISSKEGINKYRVESNPLLQLLVGLDVDDKIRVLLIQEYMPD